jgi:hypothetical protein
MMASRAESAAHESFLRHRDFRWLKFGSALSLLALIGYLALPAAAGPYGGTWFGYTLGTLGAGLIVWLACLGVRKRRMTPGNWSLRAWTSAHVWLGLSLIVIATLHTGMRLGWNLATLAWTLMILVIASGTYGIIAYSTLPVAMSRERDQQTRPELIEGLRAIDRQLIEAAQPLGTQQAEAVLAATAQSPFDASLRERLAANPRHCATHAALDALAGFTSDAAQRVRGLLSRRLALLARIRAQMRMRALLEVWLHIHVPMTVALLAALTAHIVSVFYYW